MKNNDNSLFWYDYETTGIDPQKDRILQFAGVRTDEDFNIIDEPVSFYCKPSTDILPQPEACLITGITPQIALAKGVVEAEFCRLVLSEFSKPHTCVVGYNSIRFDDEFTRYLLYRNLRDAYAREWQNGNTRWDIIDMVRGAYALRPEGIEWPLKEDGSASFKLEELARANNIRHEHAHDALSDVYATIGLAKLVRDQQPKFYQFVFDHRIKSSALKELSLLTSKALVHVSSKYPSKKGCMAIVLPLAMHPVNKNAVIVYDLSVDPEPFLSLGIDALRARLFTSKADLPDGVERLAVKLIHANKCPLIAPINTVTKNTQQRFSIDLDLCNRNMKTILMDKNFIAKLPALFPPWDNDNNIDPEHALYSGGFFSNQDREKMESLHRLLPAELSTHKLSFSDNRLATLLFRYRARNYPQSLDRNESVEWSAYRKERLTAEKGGGSLTLDAYYTKIQKLLAAKEVTERDRKILDELTKYGNSLSALN